MKKLAIGGLHFAISVGRERLTEMMLFCIVGSTAMAIHYGIYYVLLPVLPVNVSFSLGYFISFLYNFTMTSYFTFKVKPSVSRFFRFAASHGTNYLLQILLLNFFIHVAGLNEKMAPVPVYAISVPVNYMLVRLAMKHKL
jgi:putative flippase GtrA